MFLNEVKLVSELGGFGLSDYEAQAYVALLTHGSLKLNDLPYYTLIPRTKAYSTIRKLERKKLVEISSLRPLRVYPNSPNNIFRAIVSKENNRVRGLIRTLDTLTKLEKQSAHMMQAKEGRYLVLNPAGLHKKIKELLGNRKGSFSAVLNESGIKSLTEAIEGDFKSLFFGDTSRVILACNPGLDTPDHRLFSSGDVRVINSREPENLIVRDNNSILITNDITGRGIYVENREIAQVLEAFVFEPVWKKAFPLKDVIEANLFFRRGSIFPLLEPEAMNQVFVDSVLEAVSDPRIACAIREKILKKVSERVFPAGVLPYENNISQLFSYLAKKYKLENRGQSSLSEADNQETKGMRPFWEFVLTGTLTGDSNLGGSGNFLARIEEIKAQPSIHLP